MKKSNIFLIAGMVVLAVGAVLSIMDYQPYSDYVLLAGAVLIVLRGALRNREHTDNQ